MAKKLLPLFITGWLLFLTSDIRSQSRPSSSPAKNVSSDLYAAAEQSLVDKVVSDAQYPLTIVDQWWPFDPNSKDKTFSAEEVKQQLARAKTIDCSKTSSKDVSCIIQKTDLVAREMLHESVDSIRRAKAKAGTDWRGPSGKELDELESRSLPVKEHLAHLHIELSKAPSIKISGISTSLNDVSVEVDAIGETWVQVPTGVCTKVCSVLGIEVCCEGHVELQWRKILEIDTPRIDWSINADVALVADNLIVYGVPIITRLVLDYEILRDINLEYFANLALRDKRLPIIDATKIVAVLPYVNTKYRVKDLAVSGAGEIRVDVVVEKVP
jgi:hypothetical protein